MSDELAPTTEDEALVAEVHRLAVLAHATGALKAPISAVLAEAMILLELNRTLLAELA